MRLLLLSSFLIAFTQLSLAQSNCFNLGSGEDGIYHATSDTTLLGGTYNFTSFTIDPNVTVQITGNSKLIIHCQGAATINGVISANGGNGSNGVTYASAGAGGIGVAGGSNGGDGTYSSSGGPISASNGLYFGGGGAGQSWSGGGGAGYSLIGGDSGNPAGGFGGIVYGSNDLSGLLPGSGGGGGSGGYSCGAGGGGAGGGVIVFNTDNFTIGLAGVVCSNGGNGGSDDGGNCGGGGAGSGGAIWIASNTISNYGLISAIGGVGGASSIPGSPYFGIGGSGSMGRIRLDYSTLVGSGLVNPVAETSFEIPTSTQNFTICFGESITIATNTYNVAGSYQDTLQSTLGCDSIIYTNLSVIAPIIVTQNVTICFGESVIVNGNTYASTNIYQDVFTSVDGCDSTVITDLTVENEINLSTSIAGNSISSNQVGATYEWIDCDNGNVAISNETNQLFTPENSGNYAVIVTLNNCSDTSACVPLQLSGIEENDITTFVFYPNPTDGELILETSNTYESFLIEIYSANGQLVYSKNEIISKIILDLSEFKSGMYYMNLSNEAFNQKLIFVRN